MSKLEELEDHAARLRNHIARIRIDFPEAADARRFELHQVYRHIAELKEGADRRAIGGKDRPVNSGENGE